MPKPVLSDSLFNADDVATAILSLANLQVTNNDLGVTNITNKFTLASGITGDSTNDRAYYFNGFVYIDFGLTKQSPSNLASFDLMTINDSNYYPDSIYRSNSISYQGDSANTIMFQTNGVVKADTVLVPSGSDPSFRINLNAWYRTA